MPRQARVFLLFLFLGLVLHAIEFNTNQYLIKWIEELLEKNIKSINMLGCHDGIPILDLKGNMESGEYLNGLLEDEEIPEVVKDLFREPDIY